MRALGASDPVVGDFGHQVAVVAMHAHCRAMSADMLDNVGQRLEYHEVGRSLHRLGKALLRDSRDRDWNRTLFGKRAKSRSQTALGQYR